MAAGDKRRDARSLPSAMRRKTASASPSAPDFRSLAQLNLAARNPARRNRRPTVWRTNVPPQLAGCMAAPENARSFRVAATTRRRGLRPAALGWPESASKASLAETHCPVRRAGEQGRRIAFAPGFAVILGAYRQTVDEFPRICERCGNGRHQFFARVAEQFQTRVGPRDDAIDSRAQPGIVIVTVVAERPEEESAHRGNQRSFAIASSSWRQRPRSAYLGFGDTDLTYQIGDPAQAGRSLLHWRHADSSRRHGGVPRYHLNALAIAGSRAASGNHQRPWRRLRLITRPPISACGFGTAKLGDGGMQLFAQFGGFGTDRVRFADLFENLVDPRRRNRRPAGVAERGFRALAAISNSSGVEIISPSRWS